MKRSLLTAAAGLALILAFLVPYKNARAQVSIGGGISVFGGFSASGHVVISPVVPEPPSPPAIVIKPAPTIVVQPSPPKTIIVRPQPKPYAPPKIIIKAPALQKPKFKPITGVGFKVGGAFHSLEGDNDSGMGGAGLFLRARFSPHIATEIGIDAYGGSGYDGEKRTEIPISVGLLFMPMPYLMRVQWYMIGGVGFSYAQVGEDPYVDNPYYLGGFLGMGFELKLGSSRRVALLIDVRGFIRKRLNDRPDDPNIPDGGSCRDDGYGYKTCTDWEGGITASAGVVVYF